MFPIKSLSTFLTEKLRPRDTGFIQAWAAHQ